VVITTDEIAASHLDYLALGHWHSTTQGVAGTTQYAYSGAPEPVAVDQDRAGNVLLVTLDADAKQRVRVDERKVGRTRFERLELDAGAIGSQPKLVAAIAAKADPDLVFDVQLIGVRPDELDLDVDEAESELADRFLKLRLRDRSVPAPPEGVPAPPGTVLGAFIHDVEAHIAEAEAADGDAAAAELREVLRLGRLLLTGHEVTL
jgi:DNA repair exonuclease SbcCD nuclease subunit